MSVVRMTNHGWIVCFKLKESRHKGRVHAVWAYDWIVSPTNFHSGGEVHVGSISLPERFINKRIRIRVEEVFEVDE